MNMNLIMNLTKNYSTNVMYIDTVFKDLSNMTKNTEKQFQILWNERLIIAKIPLNKLLMEN